MNVLRAREILELPSNYDEALLKKNYRSLAMKFHPDKNKEIDTNEKFSEINVAYEFLLNNKQNGNNNFNESNESINNVFNNIFRSFNFQFPFPPPNVHQAKNVIKKSQLEKKDILIHLTPKEYFTGTTKSVPIKEQCSCEHLICTHCGGCGFSIPPPTIINFRPLDVCMNCVGDGYVQQCSNCQNGVCTKMISISIAPCIDTFEIFHPMVGGIKLSIDEPYYLKEKMYCKFDISLKESLTGFNKIFKDPFGDEHPVKNGGITRTNDGYQISGKANVVLVFNVIYPEKLSVSVIEQLKCIDF